MYDEMETVNKEQVFREIKFRENIRDITASTVNGDICIVVTSGE